MPTFGALVDLVKLNLFGFTQDQEQYASLNGSITSSATTLTILSSTVQEISRGLIEIEDELLQVLSVDTSASTATILPGGRGWLSTTAATHADASVIVNNPKFPRVAIKQAINDTIRGVYPDLFVVSSTTLTKSAAVLGYELPAATGEVLSVRADMVGPSNVWMPCRRYTFNGKANSTDYSTGKSIDLYDDITPGMTIQVTYTAAPTVLSSNSDEYATITGLPTTTQDLIVYGACYRLLPAYEAARLQMDSIESSERANLVTPGAASQASRYFYMMYQTRLQEERSRLQRLYPISAHYTS